MHLHRWTSGYPAIEPKEMAYACDYADGLRQLGGHFDEHAFFPFLESLGLNPRDEVTAIIQSTAQALSEKIPEIINDWTPAQRRVVLSAVYVQAALLASDSTGRNDVLKLFDDPRLREDSQIGKAICAEIDTAQRENPGQVSERMTRCVREYLELSEEGAVVRRLF